RTPRSLPTRRSSDLLLSQLRVEGVADGITQHDKGQDRDAQERGGKGREEERLADVGTGLGDGHPPGDDRGPKPHTQEGQCRLSTDRKSTRLNSSHVS